MNPSNQSVFAPHTASSSGAAEETLRLVARLDAPQGLEDRIKTGLRTAPRNGNVLPWHAVLHSRRGWMHNAMMRGAAAAAIVFAVAGGGWGVYTRLQTAQAPKAIILPPRLSAPGGFSSAGAMRTPQTLDRPVLTHKVTTAQPKPRSTAKTLESAAPRSLHPGTPSASKVSQKASTARSSEPQR